MPVRTQLSQILLGMRSQGFAEPFKVSGYPSETSIIQQTEQPGMPGPTHSGCWVWDPFCYAGGLLSGVALQLEKPHWSPMSALSSRSPSLLPLTVGGYSLCP